MAIGVSAKSNCMGISVCVLVASMDADDWTIGRSGGWTSVKQSKAKQVYAVRGLIHVLLLAEQECVLCSGLLRRYALALRCTVCALLNTLKTFHCAKYTLQFHFSFSNRKNHPPTRQGDDSLSRSRNVRACR